MKTMNNKTENKKSKLQIALLKGGAIIFSLILISFTVSAQGFWKQLLTESSLSNVAMIMAGDVSEGRTSETIASETNSNSSTVEFTVQEEADAPVQLEDWMIENKYFSTPSFEIVEEKDSELVIEDWMIENKYFSNTTVVEKDQELALESWMTDNKYWNM